MKSDVLNLLSEIKGELLTILWRYEVPRRTKRPDKTTSWVEARNLQVGGVLLKSDGTRVSLSKSSISNRQETVYNFEVDVAHTYFVGEESVLVHNDDTCVGGGDTIWEITRKHNAKYGTKLTPEQVMRANRIVDPKKLKIGQIISIENEGNIARRRNSIINETGVMFEIANNPNARASMTSDIWVDGARTSVNDFDAEIIAAAKAQDVDPNLIRGIIHLESTRDPGAIIGFDGRTIQPMNIHAALWEGLEVTLPDGTRTVVNRDTLANPIVYINAGALILRRLRERISNPTIASIGTLYNQMSATSVNNYGMTLEQIYIDQPWRRNPGGQNGNR